MPQKDFIIKINSGVRIFVYYETDKGNIISFVVKLEVMINGKWIEIERYDTHHGYVHKDILNKLGQKKNVEKYLLLDKKAGINFAI